MTTLLLVDDNDVLARFITCHIKAALPEIEVVTAPTCASARSAAQRRRVDLIMFDNRLPDGDGLSLLATLKASAPDISSILMTGGHALVNQDALVASGVLEVLHKPFETDQMLEAVQRALATRDAAQEAASGPESPQPPVRAPFFDRHAVANRLTTLLVGLRAFADDIRAVADDPEEVRRMADEYSERLLDTVRQIQRLTGVHPPMRNQ